MPDARSDDATVTVDEIWALVEKQRVCMLASAVDDRVQAWPMVPSFFRDRNEIRFLTRGSSEKSDDIAAEEGASLIFCDPSSRLYVTMQGEAEVVGDQAAIDELWGILARMYFPEGKTGGDVAVIVFKPRSAEVWTEGGALKFGWEVVKATFAPGEPDLGRHARVEM